MNIDKLKKIRAGMFARAIFRYIPSLPNSLKYGKEYNKTYRFLEDSQWFSKSELENYQYQELKKLLKHAYENVPYYRELFDNNKLKPADIKKLEDIRKMPFLTKDIIRNNLSKMISVTHRNKISYVSTGGSTGIPVGFYWQKGFTDACEQAFLWHLWNWKNIKPSDKFVILRGDVLPAGKTWYYRKYNRLLLSSYHLTDENIPIMIKEIEKYKPVVLQAYPSSAYILARWLEKNRYYIDLKLKAILTSSENLYPFQEKLFQSVFNAQVFDLYGSTERTVMINRCEKDKFHIIPQYGFTEIINKKNKWCKEENEKGEIVSTGFNNYAMPFIRYKTGDIATNSNESCKCGRNYKLIKGIEGRLHEFIVTENGRLISMTAMNMHSDVFDNVEQFQFFQEKKGKVIFNIMRGKDYTDQDTEYIRKELYKKFGNDVDLKIRFVTEIPGTNRGKYKFLIQKLPIKFGDRVGEKE